MFKLQAKSFKSRFFKPTLDCLESLIVPTTYTVSSLGDAGINTLRQAIIAANANPGPDSITFTTTGIITLATNLDPITGPVNINALSGAGTTPTIELNANTHGAFQFNAGSIGSQLRGFSIVGAAGANDLANGITLNDSNITIANNYIGLRLDGTTVLANAGDGIKINSTSTGNVIGDIDPVSGVNYSTSTAADVWQGIRGGDTAGIYQIVGTSGTNGILFIGNIQTNVGTTNIINVPSNGTSNLPNQAGVTTASTSIYGPDNLGNGKVRLVGNYTNSDKSTAAVYSNGFMYEGTTTGNGTFTTINYPGATYNYVHSNMGGLAVGNHDTATSSGAPIGAGAAYVYDIQNKSFTDVVFPGSVGNTSYGIWHNGGTSYTIVGGYTLTPINNLGPTNLGTPLGAGFMADYDSSTKQFTNWKSFNYNNQVGVVDFVTHFEGISSVEKGVYTLNADYAAVNTGALAGGSFVTVRRNTDGSFSDAVWVDLSYSPPVSGQTITSSNSVYGNEVVGVVFATNPRPYQATVVSQFQLSNVISGNGLNGIEINGSNANQVAMNYIGTDFTGNVDKGNSLNGILITNSSKLNIIGGEATGGNDPVNSVFARPPMGNLISGNNANGILINGASEGNRLSGNFIGTKASGNSALGNSLDGVAIVSANQNSLSGTTFRQNPFVFYNVLSGNGANGLRITDSNNTIVQANFMGMGANNSTIVANGGNGILASGNSKNIQSGGPIPLGNVVSGNSGNGIEIRDTVSGFVSFNDFVGIAAFANIASPNLLDGYLISSTGGNHLLRTCITSGNVGNGIHITGAASGVTIEPTIIGLNAHGNVAIPNQKNGILIDGTAHDNIIGTDGTISSNNISIIPRNTISSSGEYGIAIKGTANNNSVKLFYIGTNLTGLNNFGNGLGGILLDTGTYSNTIGGTNPFFTSYISNNVGNGITIIGSNNNTIQNTVIGLDSKRSASPNTKNGISVTNGSGNKLGVVSVGNTISSNTENGIVINSGSNNSILGNSIFANLLSGIVIKAGANNNQLAPVLSTAVASGGQTIQISGKITASANTTYQVQLFESPITTGTVQGEFYLGSISVTTNSTGAGNFQFNFAATSGVYGDVFTATATDPNGNTSAFSTSIILANSQVFAVGSGVGGLPQVNVYAADTGAFLYSFLAYDQGFKGGVRVVVADLEEDGIQEIITFPGAGGGPNVKTFSSANGTKISGPLGSFMAFDSGFSGGVFGAVGDINGDGYQDIIAGAGAGGGPNVKAFSGLNGSVLANFFAFNSSFTGGVSVAAGKINGDGFADIVVGAGAGGGPQVSIFSGLNQSLIQSFFAFDVGFTGGVFVAVGNVIGDNNIEIITGAGSGGGPMVSLFNSSASLLGSFFAFDEDFTGGVSVGVSLSSTPGLLDILVGAGAGGGPEVKTLGVSSANGGYSFATIDSLFAFDENFTGGVWVGGRKSSPA